MRHRGRHGFSVIELIIIIAIFVGLAGVVVPIVSQEIKDSKMSHAVADINRIATALNQYIKDTLFFPTGNQGATTYHYLYSDGNMPQNNIYASGDGVHISTFLNESKCGGDRWKGPYLKSIAPDPWGNAYLINVHGFYNLSERAMIISAGPDGSINTGPNASAPEGDDLMLLID